MVPKRFRTKQAIASLEKCAQCPSLPDDKIPEIQEKLNYANARLAKQDAEVFPISSSLLYFLSTNSLYLIC